MSSVPSVSKDLRIVLLGVSGVGKSATGNAILSKETFKETETTECEIQRGSVDGRNISIIDTPGINNTTLSPDQLKTEVRRCISLSSPGPHVFLLVIRVGRVTEEERNSVKWIQENFGEEALKFTMVLFTGREDITKRQWINFSQDPGTLKLTKTCGAGYYIINSKREVNSAQITKLLEKIETDVHKDSRCYYTTEMYEAVQRKKRIEKAREEEKKERDRLRKIQEEEKERLEKEKRDKERKRQEEEKERLEKEKREKDRKRQEEEKERLEKEKRDKDRKRQEEEKERLEKEKRDKDRKRQEDEKERLEKEKRDKDRKRQEEEKERLEKEKRDKDRKRQEEEKERLEKEKRDKDRKRQEDEKERLEKEKRDKDRKRQEEEKERLEKEKRDKDRKRQEEEKERLEKEKRDKDRKRQEEEKERLEKEKRDKDRKRQEEEKERLEKEKRDKDRKRQEDEKERLEKEKRDKDRKRQEDEKERLEKEKRDKDRKRQEEEKERLEKEKRDIAKDEIKPSRMEKDEVQSLKESTREVHTELILTHTIKVVSRENQKEVKRQKSQSETTWEQDGGAVGGVTPDPDSDVRIILVGKNGTGKSATGNTILDQDDFFTEEASPVSVTAECKEGAVKYGDRNVCVVDTPGIFGSLDKEDLERQINKCVSMAAPGPHAFLLVISLAGRYTEEEKKAVKWIQNTFGGDASLYTLILFTHTDQLKGKSLDTYIRESRDLLELVDRCGDRYHGFNNEDRRNRSQVTELIGKIDEMVMGNGEMYYTNNTCKRKEREKKLEKIKDVFLGVGSAVGTGVAVAGGVVLGVTEAVAIAGKSAFALREITKLIYEKLKKKEK